LQPVGERLLRIRRQAELLEDAGTLPVQPLDLRPDDLLQVAPGSVPLLANLAQPLDTVNEVIDVTLSALLVSRRRITGAGEVSIERRQQRIELLALVRRELPCARKPGVGLLPAVEILGEQEELGRLQGLNAQRLALRRPCLVCLAVLVGRLLPARFELRPALGTLLLQLLAAEFLAQPIGLRRNLLDVPGTRLLQAQRDVLLASVFRAAGPRSPRAHHERQHDRDWREQDQR